MKDLRTANHKLKRSEAQAVAALKVRPSNELGVEEESNVLTVFSEWMNTLSGERIKQIYPGFTAYGEPLLTSMMINNKIIPELTSVDYTLPCKLQHTKVGNDAKERRQEAHRFTHYQ